MDRKTAERNKKADFCLLSALWTPEGDEWGLRLVTDWNHWVRFHSISCLHISLLY